MPRLIAPIGLTLMACTSEVTLSAPTLDPRTESELVVVDVGESARYLLLGKGDVLLSAPVDAVVHWLQLGATPEALGVEPGVLELVADPTRWVPSPAPEVLSTQVRSFGDPGWAPDDRFAAPLDRLFGHACGESVAFTAPSPPECPRWMTTTEGGCALPVRADCPAGSVQFGLDESCTRYALDCPTGDYAADLPTGVVYVDAAAAPGGDGSSGLPFGSLSLALQSGAATIALAAGDYSSLGLPLLGPIFGRCATDTHLRLGGTPIVDTLAGVTLDDPGVLRGGAAREVVFALGLLADGAVGQIDSSIFARSLSVEGATVALDRVYFEPGSTAQLQCDRGAISGTRVAAEAGVRGRRCSFDFEDTNIGRVVSTSSGALTLRRSFIHGEARARDPTILSEVWIEGDSVRCLEANGSPLVMSDVAISAVVYAIQKQGSTLTFDRLWTSSPGTMDVVSAMVDGRDLIADTTSGDYEVNQVLNFWKASSKIVRADIVGRGQAGLSIRSSDVTFRDLELVAFDVGFFSSGSSFGLEEPGEHLTLDRFTIEDCSAAIVLTPGGILDAQDGAFRRNGRWLEACNNPSRFARVEVDQCVESTCGP